MKVLLSAYNLYDVAFENNPKTIRIKKKKKSPSRCLLKSLLLRM